MEHNCYVQVKKFEKDSEMYTCRKLGEDGVDIEVHQKQLLKEVKIKVLTIGQANTQSSDLSVFKVGVNDKVSKLISIF